MLDLKTFNSALDQLEEEKGIMREKIIEAIEQAIAAAYKKDYGKKGQIVRAYFDLDSGKTEFEQVKIVADDSTVRVVEELEEGAEIPEVDEDDMRPRFNPEHHILIDDARRIKKDAEVEDEIVFPLEAKEDYGRIAAQTAKQVIIQKIREAEKVSVLDEYSSKVGTVISGTVQRVERGNVFIDMGRVVGLLSPEEQIPGEFYRQGSRMKVYIADVVENARNVNIKLSRAHPNFLKELFAVEVPEINTGVIEIKAIAREAGSRSKIAITSTDDKIDPIGAMVGQRGVRVSAVMNELGNEKIDIIEWADEPATFIERALSPATIADISVEEEEQHAKVVVSDDQLSLAIGKGGQNVRLAAKLTGWKIDIEGVNGGEESEEKSEDKVITEKEPVEVEEDKTKELTEGDTTKEAEGE